MDWFRVDSDLPRHPHVLRLADKLDIGKAQALGHLTMLWCAVAEHAEDGSLANVTDGELEAWAEWPRDRKNEFANALRDAGWIGAKKDMSGWAKRHEYMLRERKRKQELRNGKPDAARPARAPRAPRPEGDARTARALSAPPRGDAANRTVPDRTVPDEATAAAPAHRLLAERWNLIAESHGLPKVKIGDAPAWADKAKARVGEGVLERWIEVATGIASVMADRRYAAKRPNWLTFAHLVANGTNWLRLAMQGEGGAGPPAKVNLFAGIDLSQYCDPEPSMTTEASK